VEGLGAALRAGSDFSLVKLTPTHLSLLSQQLTSEQAVGRTRAFVIGGEALTYEALSFWRTHAPATRLLNEYGPTETVVGCCVHEVSAAEASSGSVPIGRPIANVELHVLDSQLRLVPVGVPGELYIGGVPLARGYLGRPELTAEKFVPHPFSSTPGARLYRTGDLARRRADGVLEFLGRADEQVKVRGFRIELGEIESVLASYPAVREATVVVREDQPGDKRLVAYVTGEAKDLGTPELRRVLESKLPAYMVPSAFVVLEALPLTPNGKVDRKALPAPDGLPSETRDFVAPRDILELQLTQVFEEVLGGGPIGAKSDFFELGGHSLLAVQLLRRIEQATGRSLPMSALFEGATVEHLAHLLRQEPRPWTPLVPMGREEGGRPFFCVHPVGGNVLCYTELARALGPELRFYGLQAPGLEGVQAPLETFEALAATFVAAVRTVQPHGPYLLGGWSMGGGLALEMAQQLQRQGEQVELLAVIDGYAGAPEGLLPPEDAAAVMTALFAQHLAAVTGEGTMMPDEALAGMEPEQMLQHLLEEGRKSAAVTPDTELPRLRALRQVFASNQRASAAWRPGPYAGSIELFRTTDPGKDVADQERSWKQLARDGVVVHDLSGDHYSVLRAPHVQVLARLLKESLARIRTGEEEQAKRHA
jgi:thioesterase domain-containing protein/acyl carrier protein